MVETQSKDNQDKRLMNRAHISKQFEAIQCLHGVHM